MLVVVMLQRARAVGAFASEDGRSRRKAERRATGILHGAALKDEVPHGRMHIAQGAFEGLRLKKRGTARRPIAETDGLDAAFRCMHAGTPGAGALVQVDVVAARD